MTQKEAFDILKMGHNVYLTGAAGSGKTHLLNQYISYLKTNKIPVGVTASTGIAATHMGGTTIHSYVGMGIKDVIDDRDMSELLKRQYLRSRFLRTKVLIIDEVSMLHAHRLDIVHSICRAFKRIEGAFGGMQVVMCGDFFQLPPVKTRNDPEAKSNISSDFIYHSEVWKEMELKICYLDEQYRTDDRAFLRVLNDIRNNEVNESTVEYLTERMNEDVGGYVRPTRLFTHNADVDVINNTQLEALGGEVKEYFMTWRGSLSLTQTLRKSCLAPEKLLLKIGAQVMFVKNNYEAGYVNGTLGEVINFDRDDMPIVRTYDGAEISVHSVSWEVKEEDVEKAAISQLPLRLAWAITVHKSQGMSLDAAEIDLSKSFLPGMGYVALSRVRSLSGLKLLGLNQMALQVNSDVMEIDVRFRKESDKLVLYLHDMTLEKKKILQSDFLSYLKGEN